MAYRDENGRITIDEVAAMEDVRKLTLAIDDLAKAEDALKEAMLEAEQSKGKTAIEMAAKAAELHKRIQDLRRDLANTQDYIRSVVKNYQAKDERLRIMMESRR